jgi:hypothetical protein
VVHVNEKHGEYKELTKENINEYLPANQTKPVTEETPNQTKPATEETLNPNKSTTEETKADAKRGADQALNPKPGGSQDLKYRGKTLKYNE